MQTLLHFIPFDEMLDFLNQNSVIRLSVIALIGGCIGLFLRMIIDVYPDWLNCYWQKLAVDYLVKTQLIEQTGSLFERVLKHDEYFFPYLIERCRHGYYQRLKDSLPVIEVMTATLTVLIVSQFSAWLPVLVLCYILMILMFIDLHTLLLPDFFTLSLLWLGLFANLTTYFVTIEQGVIGAICGYLSLWLIYWLAKLCFRVESMGYGDFKLLAALGAWFGWQALPEIVLYACISALFAMCFVSLFQKNKLAFREPIAFGSYLSLAGIVMIFK